MNLLALVFDIFLKNFPIFQKTFLKTFNMNMKKLNLNSNIIALFYSIPALLKLKDVKMRQKKRLQNIM